MANAPAWRSERSEGSGSRGSGATPWSDEEWDAPTHVRSASADQYGRETYNSPPPYRSPSASWLPDATSVYRAPEEGQASERDDGRRSRRADRTAAARPATSRTAAAEAPQRGIAGWQAVLVLIAISAVGGAIDLLRGSAVKGGFNIALIVASIVAILLVRRRSMFPVLVAPPLVYFVASAGLLYIRSSGLHDRSRLLDAGINWLVYGFPAIAGATAAVLIIGGIRLALRR